MTVDKPLAIRGPGIPQNPNNVNVCTTGAVSDPTTEAIVDGLPFAFLIDSDGVTLNGFVIQAPRSESATGVLVGPFGGYDIVANLFQNNAQDIRLQGSSSDLAASEVRGNCFRGIGPLGLGTAGFAVVTGFGVNVNTSITDNTKYRKGVAISLIRSGGVSIQNNLAFQGFFFLEMQDAHDDYVTDNVVAEMQQTAISGRAANFTIANNAIEQSGRDAIAPVRSATIDPRQHPLREPRVGNRRATEHAAELHHRREPAQAERPRRNRDRGRARRQRHLEQHEPRQRALRLLRQLGRARNSRDGERMDQRHGQDRN